MKDVPFEPIARGTVPIGIACIDCGYLLLGLPLVERCPECGLAIERTLRRLRALEIEGDPASLQHGLAWVLGGAVAALAAPFIAAALMVFMPRPQQEALRAETALVLLILVSLAAPIAASALTWNAVGRGVFNRRVLAASAGAIPLLLLLGGRWMDPRQIAWAPVRQSWPSLTLALITAAFLVSVLLEVRRRVRLWPGQRVLPALMLCVAAAVVSGALLLLASMAGASRFQSGRDWGPLVQFGPLAAMASLAAGTAGAFLLLLIVLAKLLRRRRARAAAGEDLIHFDALLERLHEDRARSSAD